MPIKLNNDSRKAVQALAAAFATGEQESVEQALDAYRTSIVEDVTAQYEQAVAAGDASVLAQRGFRQLTTPETTYYQGVIEALSSSNPRQALTDFSGMPDHMMPTTIFDQILKDIQEAHPLLAAVNVVNVGYITEWLRNKHTRQLAVWGTPGEAITKEIASAFEVVDVKQGKLSCFALVSLDMLKLGPTWLDGYVRTVVGEAIACGLEYGIATGKGVKGEPIGLDRDIHSGVSVNQSTGYPQKSAITVTSFDDPTVSDLVARLIKDEQGKFKTVDYTRADSGLTLLCSPTDYCKKVYPVIHPMRANGVRDTNALVYPIKPIPCACLEDGRAILALLGEYDVFVGGNRGIEYSDEFKFLEDQRVFKQVMYAFGRAYDNTSAEVLDISNLVVDEAPAVKVKGTVTTKAQS
jgi:hypothetical protein